MNTIKYNSDGLVSAIIQDQRTKNVLMLGYMNEESLAITKESGLVTFFSRSRNELWQKGAASGNCLKLVDIKLDCDKDALLIRVNPVGPVCHTGTDTCWSEPNEASPYQVLESLEQTIINRKQNPSDSSYTSSLFQKGIAKIAQKVGEEAVETVIEAMRDEPELFLNEAADLMYHYLVLLQAKGFSMEDVTGVLRERER
ncbi:MAG: bifunctional phosphoribosyl-AMP cyclohydrolase/phosphoribosyl-ATP diphosphatase HisIE [Bacteroidota bacterium]